MNLIVILSSGIFVGFWIGFVIAMIAVMAKTTDRHHFKLLK
jgi:hypothetical protein